MEEEIYLRKLSAADAGAVHTAFAEDEGVEFFTQRKYKKFHDTKTLVEWLCTSGEYFSVVRKTDDRMIGIAGTRPVKERPGVVRLAYILQSRYRGRGIMPYVIRSLTEHVLGSGEVQRIEAAIRPDNIRSLRCIEKAGYHMEKVIEAQPDETGDGSIKKRILYVYEKH